MAKITVSKLKKMKQDGEKIAALTAYDASFSSLFEQQGVHVLLVGDSMGMVLQGGSDTLAVTNQDIAYHTRCVRAGANMVKVEGGEWLYPAIELLTQQGIPVCGHLGLTPQSVHVFGGFKIQGRSNEAAQQMIKDAQALEAAGAQLLVLECIPSELAKAITDAVSIPTIGIGAGKDVDGQILVMHDLVGISAGYIPKFSKNFLLEAGNMPEAVKKYIDDVQNGDFPAAEHEFN